MGGGGHHHHGGHHGGGWYGSGYGYIDAGPVVIERERCPDFHAPVVGSDRRVYRNACYAQMAGARIVKSLAGMGETSPNAIGVRLSPYVKPAAVAVGAYLLYRHLKKKGG